MITGIGIDIAENQRIIRLHQKHPNGFLEKLLSSAEIKASAAKKPSAQQLCGIFVAKEAIIKALGGVNQISFPDITITKDKLGKPSVTINPKKMPQELQESRIHISISHEKEYSTGLAIIESL